MKRLLPFVKNATKYLPLFVLILFTLSSCASHSYMKVNYQLPDNLPDKPAITKIRLSVVDQRNNPDPLSITAREKLKNFRESYMLIMAPKGDTPVAGVYDLMSLFETVFRKRLDQMGIRVVDSTSSKIPKLELAVTLFQLDLRDYKWHFRMGYTAMLVKDGNGFIKETISGESERVDVPGMDDSGTTVSEVYADLINQLDISVLLSK
ncbi:MAG: hypothetical protein OES64_07945 [Desulfobacteraceae bacterium]|jgi:hypothetical protein|nr:hypothetical protein [Desulfobacteraceae bacterium]